MLFSGHSDTCTPPSLRRRVARVYNRSVIPRSSLRRRTGLLEAPLRAHADALTLALIVALTVLAWLRLIIGGTMVGQDAATQFYPWFSYLGQGLRSGGIPEWNPHQFSGAPFAADPQSGWMYLPAMLLFTMLPFEGAVKAYMLIHLLLGGLGMYALARALGMDTIGALVAAVGYEYAGFLYGRIPCCPNHSGIMTWLPITILGAEMAIRSQGRVSKCLWWGLSGLALSQILAIWLGQGSYYALLALGGYVAYRTVLAPPQSPRDFRARLTALVLHGGAVLVFGFGLAAAGLLPRIEYNLLSNLAGGYSGTEQAVMGGWSVKSWGNLLVRDVWYVGGATLALASLSVFIARGRPAVWYFALLCAAALLLAIQIPTPLHLVLYLVLPGFERLHPHLPEHVTVWLYLGAALLAGTTVTHLGQSGTNSRRAVWVLAAGALLASALVLILPVTPLAAVPRAAIVASGMALALSAVALGTRRRWLLRALLLLLVFTDLSTAGPWTVPGRAGIVRKVDLQGFYQSGAVDEFLQSRSEEGPFRFVGYYPEIGFLHPLADELLADNRATPLGLEDVQGYNPVHLARYDEYVAALNRRPQRLYRRSYVYEQGLRSPLLDLLNARYLIVPSSPDRPALRRLRGMYPTVYRDGSVLVLRRIGALPRAWIVHSARRVERGRALELLSSGVVDPRRTALLEVTPPALGQPVEPASDRASVVLSSADRMRIRTATDAPGLLVLSEIYYPAWKAYVDDQPAPLLVTDHVLRAVPVPAGEHLVELRYESAALRVGVFISIVFYVLLVAVGLAAVLRRYRAPPPLSVESVPV